VSAYDHDLALCVICDMIHVLSNVTRRYQECLFLKQLVNFLMNIGQSPDSKF